MKGKPIGVRFDIDQLEQIKKERGLKTTQQVVNFFFDSYFGKYDKPVKMNYENDVTKIDPAAGDMQVANKILHDGVLQGNEAMSKKGHLVLPEDIHPDEALKKIAEVRLIKGEGEREPKEGSYAFFNKYGAMTHAEREQKSDLTSLL